MGRAAPRPARRGRAGHLGRRQGAPGALASPGGGSRLARPRRSRSVIIAAIAACLLPGCDAFAPEAHLGASFHDRAETKEDAGFRVTAAALSGEEARRFLGVDLERKGIRPIWVEIENRSGQGAWYFPIGTDPTYFAPYEVAYMFHRWWAGDRNRRISEHLIGSGMPLEIPPRGIARGFVYTHDGEGTGYVRVEIVDDAKVREFRFVSQVPGERWDFQRVDFASLYPESQVRDLDFPALLEEIEKLPCCAADEAGNPVADPLNLVVVGKRREVAFPFVQRGWNLTEPFDVRSAWRSVKAFVRGSPYRTSPVSPLYLFGRPQDAALQKPRNDIDRRNHLRVWLAPFTFEGRQVWVGQVSRDIGVRLTTRSWYLTTHKIDPDVDESRDYLLQDLVMTGCLSRVAFVPGVGAAPRSDPRQNLTGDPYFTDGERLLLVMDSRCRAIDEIQLLIR